MLAEIDEHNIQALRLGVYISRALWFSEFILTYHVKKDDYGTKSHYEMEEYQFKITADRRYSLAPNETLCAEMNHKNVQTV